MLEERIYNQPKQKLIYSRDSSMNFGLKNSIKDSNLFGLFKTNSSLSRSIRSNASTNMSNTLQSSAALILSQSKSTSQPKLGINFNKMKIIPEKEEEKIKLENNIFNLGKHKIISEVPRNQMNIKIRNIIHDYTDIDHSEYSYNVFSTLKSKKRMKHLDIEDEFEVWKKNKITNTENEVKEKVKNLKQYLNDTQNEIYSKFSMTNEELIPMVQKDIDEVIKFYNGVFNIRDNNINICVEESVDLFNKCHSEVLSRISKLGIDLDKVGYKLEEEIKEICEDKKKYINRFTEAKTNFYTRLINEIKESEQEIKVKSSKDLDEYILRWKNIKLNYFIKELKILLNSKEYIDCEERALIIQELKIAQENIYKKKYDLIFIKLFNLEYEKITKKNIQKLQKNLEEIIAEGDKILTEFIEKLVQDSTNTHNKSLNAIEKFKQDESTINYIFGKDNHNEKKYNDYDDIIDLNNLIEKEFNPILDKNKSDRTEYISKLNKYLDEYDDYVNLICEKILNLFLNVGTLYDQHYISLRNSEKNYMISYAKECDNDENYINEKEQELKNKLNEMKTCINKEELDKGLEESFKIMDDFEKEYRDFFKKIDELFKNHPNLITDEYHKYEAKIFLLFGLYNLDDKFAIEKRRQKESDFLSKKKEAELAEEERLKEEEAAKEEEKTGKKKAAPKKKENKPQNKKGEVPPPLVPVREINNYKSKLGFDYLIDFTIEEYVNHLLRNIIYKREDDIFELKPKSPEELEAYQKEKEEYLAKQKEEEESKQKGNTKEKSKKDDKNQKALESNKNPTEQEEIDYLKVFDPYNASSEKIFSSPLNADNEKLLSEKNNFTGGNISQGLNSLFEKIQEKISTNHQSNINDASIKDKETREDQLSELDIRLKSLAPRKGKIEVEEYDPRLNELEKHQKKLEKQKSDIIAKNDNIEIKNKNLLDKIDKNFNDLKEQNEKLTQGMEEQESDSALEEQYKKFKSNYYNFLANLDEDISTLKNYTDNSPKELLNLNDNFIHSLKLIENGGTYSQREVDFNKNELDKINNDIIIKTKEEREKINEEKIKNIKEQCDNLIKNLEEKYKTAKDNISAKDATGKIFGAPRRLANDIIFNIKLKCNQAQEGIVNILNVIKKCISDFNEIKDKQTLFKTLLKNDLPLNIRKLLQKINTCIFYYGKYISAFKDSFLNSYKLNRVIMKENIEDHTITEKEDLDFDEQLKKEELLGLGLLSKFLLEGNPDDKKGNKDEILYTTEIKSIDDKIKSECAKIYTGNFAKYLNQTEKMPDCLIPFLEDIRRDMEIMRLKNIKDLRTICQNLYEFSLKIPAAIYKFIYGHLSMNNNNKINELMMNFEKNKNESELIKNELKMKLGPYLANPYFSTDLEKFESKNNERNINYLKSLNETQFNLITNEEELSKNFIIRILNNFGALMTLFDNFIFEEEFISLGDEEYFRKREDYNELLKLKDAIDEKNNPQGEGGKKPSQGQGKGGDISKYDLESKRTFKKNYKGINYTEGKINYYEKFNKEVKNCVENSEEKILLLENEYKRDNWSKSLIGIKMQNNKNLFLERNKYYEQHCLEFNKNITEDINKFNALRLEELEYKYKWDELVKDLKDTVKKFNIPEGVKPEKEEKEEKKPSSKKTSKKTGKKK